MENKTILTLYPNHRGICYSISHEGELIGYGIKNVYPICYKKALKRIKKSIEYYRPDVVITRDLSDLKKHRNRRIQKLVDAICKEATSQGLQVHSFTRTQIMEVFESFKCTSKFEISKKLMEWFKELKTYTYPKRKAWLGEHYNVGVFDAVSLLVTFLYYQK